MDFDFKAGGVAAASILTAVGGVVAGIYSGRAAMKRESIEADKARSDSRLAREAAEDVASRQRVEDIAQDAREARQRADLLERESDKRTQRLARDRDRGWDLARYHYGIVRTLAHILNNIFLIHSLTGPDGQLREAVSAASERMKQIQIPNSLEEPIPAPKDEAETTERK